MDKKRQFFSFMNTIKWDEVDLKIYKTDGYGSSCNIDIQYFVFYYKIVSLLYLKWNDYFDIGLINRPKINFSKLDYTIGKEIDDFEIDEDELYEFMVSEENVKKVFTWYMQESDYWKYCSNMYLADIREYCYEQDGVMQTISVRDVESFLSGDEMEEAKAESINVLLTDVLYELNNESEYTMHFTEEDLKKYHTLRKVVCEAILVDEGERALNLNMLSCKAFGEYFVYAEENSAEINKCFAEENVLICNVCAAFKWPIKLFCNGAEPCVFDEGGRWASMWLEGYDYSYNGEMDELDYNMLIPFAMWGIDVLLNMAQEKLSNFHPEKNEKKVVVKGVEYKKK